MTSTSSTAGSLLSAFNRLLPFATPGTPLLQDCLHLATLCLILYFAPQIQERIQRARSTSGQEIPGDLPDPALETEQQEAEQVQNPDPAAGIPAPGNENEEPNNDNGINNNNDALDERNEALAPDALGPASRAGNRNIGAKKAKSLARRDQRRAYHEFQRAQGDAQRAADAAGAEERAAREAGEKERRAGVERALEAKKVAEREARRELEAEMRRVDRERREAVVAGVRDSLEASGLCDLFAVANALGDGDEEFVEDIVRASGVLDRRETSGEEMTILTGMGWVVRVRREDVLRVYDELAGEELGGAEEGRIGMEKLGLCLERIIRERNGVEVGA